MTYTYECKNCEKTVEIEQRISEKPILTCPECHKDALSRMISGSGAFVLKGECWEKDGYK